MVVWSNDSLRTDIKMFIHKYRVLLFYLFVGFGVSDLFWFHF